MLWTPPPPRVPAPRLVLPTPDDPTGSHGPKPSTARGPHWRWVARHLFVPASAEVEQPGQRILEASLCFGEGQGAVSGWAALHLWGAPWFEGRDARGHDLPVLLVGSQRRRIPAGARLLRTDVTRLAMVTRHGIPCVDVHQALFDEIRSRNQLRPAVAAIDMVLHAQLTTLAAFRTWLARVLRVRGVTLARRAVELAAPGAESPPESGLRLRWSLDAGLGPPLPNVDIHSLSGRFLGRPDLFDPAAAVAGDYDGLHHRETQARAKDITREGLFRDHGIEYFSVVAGEMHDRQFIVERITAAYERAARSAHPQLWEMRIPQGHR